MFLTYWPIHEDGQWSISDLISRIIIISTDNYDSLNQIRSVHRNITDTEQSYRVGSSGAVNPIDIYSV